MGVPDSSGLRLYSLNLIRVMPAKGSRLTPQQIALSAGNRLIE
jgi:hypothetical protein